MGFYISDSELLLGSAQLGFATPRRITPSHPIARKALIWCSRRFSSVRARGLVVTVRVTAAHADRVLLSPLVEAHYTGQMITVVKCRPVSMEAFRLR